jgi:signal transduction histidine kinase
VPPVPAPHQRPEVEAFSEMAGTLAREIAAPLTAIEMAVSRIRRRDSAGAGGGPEGDDELRVILEQSHRLGCLARTLLQLGRPVEPRMREVELGALVTDFARTLEAHLSVGGITLSTDLPSAPVHVLADPHQLRETLLALITNAQQALEGWEGRREVHLQAGRLADGGAYVRVSDSGPGVAEGEEERVFVPFVSGWGRAGVGLALCRLSLLRQGVELLMDPRRADEGASFTLTFDGSGTHDLEIAKE